MGKHTPGPWIGDRGFRDAMLGGEHTTIENDFITIFCGEDNANAVDVHGPNQVANARLIAAAPEMLEVLKAVEWAGERDEWETAFVCPSCYAREMSGHLKDCQLYAAIAKAEGRT